MTEVTDVYHISDFDWDGHSHIFLNEIEAGRFLDKWNSQIEERTDKLVDLLVFDGVIESKNSFPSSKFDDLEKFLLQQGDLYFDKESGEFYLTAFTFELCKDIAALVGDFCMANNQSLEWSINRDVNAGEHFNSLGIVSSVDGEHVPIIFHVMEFARRHLINKNKIFGRFRKIDYGFLTVLIAQISFDEKLHGDW